jgi:hypothetical protein
LGSKDGFLCLLVDDSDLSAILARLSALSIRVRALLLRLLLDQHYCLLLKLWLLEFRLGYVALLLKDTFLPLKQIHLMMLFLGVFCCLFLRQ